MKSTRKHTRTRARKPAARRPPDPVEDPVSQEDEPWKIKDYGGFRIAVDKKGKVASGATQLLMNSDLIGTLLGNILTNRQIAREARRERSLLFRSLRVLKRVLHEVTA